MAEGDFWAGLETPRQAKGDFWAGLDQPTRTTEAMPVEYKGTTPAAPPKRMSELAGGAEAKIQAPGGFWRTLGEGLLQGGPQGAPLEVAPPPAERLQQALRFVTAPFEAISRGVARPVAETGLVEPQFAEKIGEGVAAVAGIIPPGRTAQAIRGIGVRPPARTMQELLPQARLGLPPPAAIPERAGLPPGVTPRALPSPDMPTPMRAPGVEGPPTVFEGSQLQTPGGATMPGPITRAPQRTVTDLIDEVKLDVKQQVINEIFDELKTGATQTMPRRQAPLQIGASRRLTEAAPRLSAGAGDMRPALKVDDVVVAGDLPTGMKRGQIHADLIDKLPPTQREKFLAASDDTMRGFIDDAGNYLTREQAAAQRGSTVIPKVTELPTGPAIELPPPERPKIVMGQSGYRGGPTEARPAAMREPGPAVAPQPTIQDLIANAQAKRKPVSRETLPEEPPFEIPPQIQKETPVTPPQATFTRQAIPEAGPAPEVVAGGKPSTLDPNWMGGELPWSTKDKPWQMTKSEFVDWSAKSTNLNPEHVSETAALGTHRDIWERGHKTLVKNAVKRGDPVPVDVLAEYPDLPTPKRTPLDILKEETGAVKVGKPEQIELYRGEMAGGQKGNYYSTDREWSRQFTQSGQDKEIKSIKVNVDDIYRPPVLPKAAGFDVPGQPNDIDKALAEAKRLGKKGIFVDEGPGQPESVFFVTPRNILKSEKGALMFGREDPMAAIRPEHFMGSRELGRKSFTTRGSKIFEDMGPSGKELGRKLDDADIAGARRKAQVAKTIDDIRAKYPNVSGEDLTTQINAGKARPDVAAAYREIKAAITDPIGDEATAMKIKVKNPITGVERAFQKRQRYVPQLIDPAKVAKNPTRLVDAIMEELIADGIDPGKARTQATMMVHNMSRKSGSLQFMRTGKFDPNIHITDGWEAYKRAAMGEVERIEALKRFGKVDEAGLLGDEIGGIRDLTNKISAEAGPEAAQKAELWATRQIGMQRGEIDTVQKKAGELLRNFNTLKLGFLPVTNLAAQAPMIMAAGKTTRWNPIKSLQIIGEAFGKSGKGAELGKIFGVAVDNTAEEMARKFDLARSGPGGKMATAFLHYTGGTKSENFVAKLAANVGNEEAKYVIQKLLDNPGSKSAQKAVNRYGLDPANVLREGATEENIFRIGHKFANEVLLRGNVLDLPPAFTSESGKVFFQFKRATQILAQQMYDAAKNDPGKLIALITASQIGGEAMLDIKAGARGTVAALVSGDPRKIQDELKRRPEGVRRILDNWAAALSFSYLGDTVMDVAGGVEPKNIISGASVATSPFESALHVTQGAGTIARGEKGGGKQILGGVLQQAPGGTFFRGLTRPEKSERQKLLEDLGLSKMLKERGAARKEMLEQLGLER